MAAQIRRIGANAMVGRMPGVVGRRTAIAGGIGLAAALAAGSRPARAAAVASAGIPDNDTLAFTVSRNGCAIGMHRLDFTRNGRVTTVRIDAAFRVGFSFITLYRYHHRGVETWQDGQFQSLETTTNDNGTMFHVRAERTGAGIAISATGLASHFAPLEALPLTHWAKAAMTAPLFNPQTGTMLRETAMPQGSGLVRLADGTKIAATRYALAGEAPIEDWYDQANVWAALDGTGKDGSDIAYRRI